MSNKEMKAIGIYRALPIEHPDALVDITVPVPQPAEFELLVQVEAVSVNPADFRVRKRKADDGQHAILGWDAAGTVVSAGVGVTNEFMVGDKVYYAGDVTRPGANAEFHVVDYRIVGHRPQRLSPALSASVPLTALTAWEALFERIGFSLAAPNRFRSLLIVGGAGGTGSMVIQLAKLIPGLQVIATASRPESAAWCRSLGADDVINHFADMREQLAELRFHAVDAILILNNPDTHISALMEILAPRGCICSIVPFEHPVDINPLMRKSATFTWEYMFTRPMFKTKDMAEQRRILNEMTALIESGRVVPTTTETLHPINAKNLRAAHQLLEAGRTIGKITLEGF